MQRRKPITLEPLGRAWFMMVLFHGLLGLGIWWGLTSMDWETADPAAPRVLASAEAKVETLDWRSPSDFRIEAGSNPVAEATEAASLPASEVEALSPTPEEDVDEESPIISGESPVPTVAESAAMVPRDLRAESEGSPAKLDRAANRFITLSRLTSDLAEPPSASVGARGGGGPVPTLMDIARMPQMSPYSAGTGQGDTSTALDEVDTAVQEAFLKNWVAPPVSKVDPEKRSAHLEVSIGKDGTVLGTLLSRPSGSSALDKSIDEAAEKVKKIPLTLPAGFGKPYYELQVNFQID